jgi:hypothetical protein
MVLVDYCHFMLSLAGGLGERLQVWEVCRRIFTCNCLDGLAILRLAERICQPKLGLDFQMRKKDETHD